MQIRKPQIVAVKALLTFWIIIFSRLFKKFTTLQGAYAKATYLIIHKQTSTLILIWTFT